MENVDSNRVRYGCVYINMYTSAANKWQGPCDCETLNVLSDLNCGRNSYTKLSVKMYSWYNYEKHEFTIAPLDPCKTLNPDIGALIIRN